MQNYILIFIKFILGRKVSLLHGAHICALQPTVYGFNSVIISQHFQNVNRFLKYFLKFAVFLFFLKRLDFI